MDKVNDYLKKHQVFIETSYGAEIRQCKIWYV